MKMKTQSQRIMRPAMKRLLTRVRRNWKISKKVSINRSTTMVIIKHKYKLNQDQTCEYFVRVNLSTMHAM